jgi:lysophospholipase L1-like esterase
MAYIYGSGVPVDYRKYSRYLSAEARWENSDVWLFGDSILFGAKEQVISRLTNAGKTCAIDAWSSRPMTPAVDSLRDHLANPSYIKPKRVVMAVGTNDIFDPTVVLAQIQRAQVLCEFAGVELIWVDAFARREGFREADLINCAWVNQQIHGQIPADRVVNWYRLFAASKNRIAARLSDGVHPIDGQGDDFWAFAVMEVLLPQL